VPKIRYEETKFKPDRLAMLRQVQAIVEEYQVQDLDLSSRQVYYQMVSRDLFPAAWADPRTGSTNNERSYKKLCALVADGRMAGMIDWETITDRGRFVRRLPSWRGPAEIVSACAEQFRLDKWARQETYVEAAVEKDALIGVLDGVCTRNEIPYLACKGYTSLSEVWRMATQRFAPRLKQGKRCVLLYLGDHDPSGLDMTRDLQARLNTFTGNSRRGRVEVHRLALNYEQVELYRPPNNPTKVSDSRTTDYRAAHGESCWELDALNPTILRDLIQSAVESYRDDALWDEAVRAEDAHKRSLARVAGNWQDVVARLPEEEGDDDVPNIFD
jgi:hypothetical protein